MGLIFLPHLKALSGVAVGAVLLVSCHTDPTPAINPCPGELTCPNFGCCPVGWPYSCNGNCYQAATSCTSSYVTCSGSSASGSGGSPGTYRPPTCNQSCQDYLSGLALDGTVWLTYNENVAGKPSGSIDQTGPCPLGGTVHITGTTSVATDGTNTLHLVFDLAGCANSAATYSLTFSGSVALDGTMNSTGTMQFTYVTFTAHGMVVSGSLKYLDDPPIEETCDVSVTQQDSGGSSSSLDGQVCGREFSSATALGGGPSGTGGAGNGGLTGAGGATSGGSCDCYCGWPVNTRCTQNTDCPNDTSVPGTSVPGVCGKPVDCAACTP
jgi:hypothetical protein